MIAFLFLLLAPVIGLAASDEDRIYEALLPNVRKVDRAFTVFHWERADSDFAEKFKPETPNGLLALTQSAAKSFLEEGASRGFYVATDPVLSRSFGQDNWRLIQIEIPEGWRYLDITGSNMLGELQRTVPNAPCLASVLASNNSKKLRERMPEGFQKEKCTRLKTNVFRRLGISGVRYAWLKPQLNRYCRKSDPSAFIITNGNWLSKENMKAYTTDSKGSIEERKAIQEMLLSVPPPPMFGDQEPAPLWKDLPQEAGLSAETKRWMKERLVNCQEQRRQEVEDSGFNENASAQ